MQTEAEQAMDNASLQPFNPERLASPWLGAPQMNPPHPDALRDSLANLDRVLKVWIGRCTANTSPVSVWLAYTDWATHFLFSPSKQAELAVDAVRKVWRWNELEMEVVQQDPHASQTQVKPLPQDKRFADPAWQRWPFNVTSQAFLMAQQWWHRATTGVSGVSRHHEDIVNFMTRQLLDTMSPSNFLSTNPVVLDETVKSFGSNLVRGAQNAWRDWQHLLHGGEPPASEIFRVGENVAITPGKVVFRNRLIELIRYDPATEQVYDKPILFVPAWIMKYYILDLSPNNSMVKYLVNQGYTVFMISWKNPTAEDRDLSLDDYRRLGVMDALDQVTKICGPQPVNAVGYCIGGTLLSIAAAAMARDGDTRLNSITLFAAQVDFKEPGELSLFIDESQVTLLEAIMWGQGYLDTKQMAGAFQLLRSNDLIWSRRLNQYLLGKPEPQIDLMAWNADATRMPYRMHSEYLRYLFLENDLAEGTFKVNGQPIALTDIRTQIFAVGTTADHVAPWRSAFKIHILTDTDVTFLLTTGGHNAGVVSPPGQPRRSYQIASSNRHDPYVDPDTWHATAEKHDGSWWPAWETWLRERSGDLVAPPAASRSLCAAPGTYVMQR